MAGLLGSQQTQRFGLLSPSAMSAMDAAARYTPPVAPARPRGQPGFLTQLLGGSEGLDAERARRRADEIRPQMEARMAQLRAAATAMGPAAMIAFETNPEKFGESLAEQYAPQVIAAGGIQSVIGDGRRVGAPQTREFGDRLAMTDPVTQQTTYSEPRPATFQEETARLAASTANVAQDGRLVDTQTGRVIAEGVQRPDLTSVAPGGQIFATDAGGNTSLVGASTAARPMSAVDRRQQREDQDAIQTSESINTNLDNLLGQIDRGELNLGPVTNMLSQGRNAAGVSDQNSRNFASFRASLEKLRNDSLRLNNGVQTDGDSRRAWDELVANINDEKVVAQRLTEIRDINRRAIEYRQARLEDFGTQGAPSQGPAAARGSAPVTVRTPQEAAALPPGTRYRNPQGQEYIR